MSHPNDTQRTSQSGDDSQQSSYPHAPSSPLFVNPSSDAPAPPSSRRGGSSPLHYSSSSAGPTSELGNLSSDAEQILRRSHHRSDLQSTSSPRRRMFSDGPASSGPGPSGLSSSSALGTDPVDTVDSRVIWGTNISITECQNTFREFLLNFKYKYRRQLDRQTSVDDEADNRLYYVDVLTRMLATGATVLNLDARNLLATTGTQKLYHQLINYPQELIPTMDQALKDCLLEVTRDQVIAAEVLDAVDTETYYTRPFNVNEVRKGMRDLNPNDIDKLVTVKGLVIRSTAVIPDMKVAFFKCNACGHTVAVEIDRGVIVEPTVCPRQVCQQKNSMVLVHNRSSFDDKQVVKLQETPDLVPDGQTPHAVNLCMYDELVDSVRAGDRIEVCGVFRSLPVRLNSRQRAVKSLYKTYLDVLHVRKIDAKRLGPDVSTLSVDEVANKDVQETRTITDAEVAQIRDLATRDDLYELLARSLAPSIYEMDDVKKGILLQLFGGTNKTFTKGGRYRGDINVLLCGDPSTSKSQILQYVHKIAPRGVYTSGKGSSAVGLTAYITRDIDTKQLVLESGALVLSDGGVCCIDEFDKMSDATRSVLHEVMEQQTISVAKAGIITTLNARTSILASANPIDSRYNPNLPVTANIDLPPPLLSRFDLVYLILDKVDTRVDEQLARHLTSMYIDDAPASVTAHDIVPIELLTAYIQWAKDNVAPVMTPEGKSELVRSYVAMRKLGEDARASEKRITATTRQLESMIRLSEAHAKMRLSPTVDLIDVKEAVRLTKSAMKEYATDPVTGRIDMDMVQTGTTSAQRRYQEDLTEEVLRVLEQNNNSIRFSELAVKLNDNPSSFRVENHDVAEAVRRLVDEGRVVQTGDAHRRTIRRVGL
ncbi:DNA replication licensing factor Mcm4p [Diutina catenulata]